MIGGSGCVSPPFIFKIEIKKLIVMENSLAYRAVLNKTVTDALIDERRRLAKKHKTLENMLTYMDVEDVVPVITRQQEVEEELTELAHVLAILN